MRTCIASGRRCRLSVCRSAAGAATGVGVARIARTLLALMLAGCAGAERTPSEREALPAGVQRAGHGEPTVVLQAGHGDGARSWRAVFDLLASRHAVVAFDRPGYGASPPTAASRDPCTIAAEQRAMLQRLGARPPYLLVGHSLGGRYQWIYAALWPHEVAGLVLIEPTHPAHWERLQAEAPAMALVVKAARLGFSPTMRREFDEQDRCVAERVGPAQLQALRRIPARVVVRERYAIAESGNFERMHRRAMNDWLELVAARSLDRVERSGHYVQRDRPDAVAAAVEAVYAARQRGVD